MWEILEIQFLIIEYFSIIKLRLWYYNRENSVICCFGAPYIIVKICLFMLHLKITIYNTIFQYAFCVIQISYVSATRHLCCSWVKLYEKNERHWDLVLNSYYLVAVLNKLIESYIVLYRVILNILCCKFEEILYEIRVPIENKLQIKEFSFNNSSLLFSLG